MAENRVQQQKYNTPEVHRDNLTDILTVSLIDIDNWIHGELEKNKSSQTFNSNYVSLSSHDMVSM